MPNPNSPSVTAPDRRPATHRRHTTGSLDRLLDGAEATFAERGYHLASVHEICARANVGIGTFYAHFDHKRELLHRLMVERATLVSSLLSADDLVDGPRLAARLQIIIDEPTASGMWRAWHEAVLEEADIARFHAQWRVSVLKDLTATVVEARKRAPSTRRRVDARVAAWSMLTLARELAIHDRGGAPDVIELAELVQELVLGTLQAD